MLYHGAMPTPVLATKLYIPPPRPNRVLRPRLIARLNEGLHRKLTIISAGAGFGKTTVVSEWLADCGRRAAWLSLDVGDSDPHRFLTYLVAALRTISPGIGEAVLGMLRSPPPPPPEAILTDLLNELAALPDHGILVLDDYHVVDGSAVDTALAFLVEYLPSQLHLVITTREDPPLPLARLRARGQLTELRAADLCFTPAEATAFLREAMGLSLSVHDIATLEARTEGWIAGLQLAALSIQGRADIPAFIRAFAGDHRYIVDYLVEEVLQRLPEGVRSFLLQTAILDRLHGSLCDAVTGNEGGGARLEALHRGNFFVVPLDDQREWYRYHHLFTEVLRAQLRLEQPDLVPTLHQRASAWYEQHGSVDDAILHALAANAFARAADLVEMAWTAARRSRQEALMLGWLKALPGEELDRRPVLSAAAAHVLLASGTLAGVEERLRSAEQWLDTTSDGPARRDTPAAQTGPEQRGRMIVVDQEEYRRLPGMIAIARAGLSLARGDVRGTVAYARQALDLAPEDDHLTRGGAAGFLGLASWTSGDLEVAHRTFADGMASLQQAGNIADAINGAITLATLRMAQGRLREAMRTYERGVQLAMEQGTPLPRGIADMYVGLSEIAREQNDLEAATQHLLHSQGLGEHAGFPQNRYRRRVAMARLRQIQGDLDGALALLDEAERLYMSDFSPNVRPIGALKARVWLAQGRLAEALGWARAQRLSVEDELSYGREFEHITLARVLLARSQSDRADRSKRAALGLLQRLLEAAEAGERTGSVIEILVVQALAHQMQGDLPAALVALERALTLAEPEGYVRLFVDEGPPMAAMLAQSTKRHVQNDPIRVSAEQLLLACPSAPEGRPSSSEEGATVLRAAHAHAHALTEPLSEREREVLRLLRTDLSGPDIARELMVSLNTLRTHTKNIYDKLGVNSRRAAVRRAEELDLV
ncbi:MAG TPA: LuxR C-terminal-related transcriptional regulator [Roseiflexaceae bacterium]|nr:LuxR C-terminal-related transcriptional regulator [Roseiflexaceae bacterium]